MNGANNTTAKSYTVKEQKGVNSTPATIGKFANPMGAMNVDPQSVPAKDYKATSKPNSGSNPATVGTFNPKDIKGYQGVEPSSTSPEHYKEKSK